MCQLGAVLVSAKRVYRKDGIWSHTDLLELAAKEYPGERFFEAEFDFEQRRWDWPERFDQQAEPLTSQAALDTMLPMLEAFADEQWGNAEKFITFVRHAGVPEKADKLLTAPAREAYNRITAPAWQACDAATASAKKAFDLALAAANEVYKETTAPAAEAYDLALASAQTAFDLAIAAANEAYAAALAPAEEAYSSALAQAEEAYAAALAAATKAYNTAMAVLWCDLFAVPKNRIEIWV